ncbi:MAG TPA: carotenoid biosynthesis protein [Anaerolineales bacterium]
MDKGKAPLRYLLGVTLISVALIILNAALGMRIPFKVSFLVGYVGALLVFVIWHGVLTKGWKRTLTLFGISYLLAFTAEALGVNFGLVFGHYYYTPMLGVSLFGVPILAALAWEPIIYAAYCISDMLFPLVANLTGISSNKVFPFWMAIIGALATTAWDMMIDPIAVSQGWWVWVDGGPYVPYVAHGVPIQNFVGWLGVAFVIHLIFRLLGSNDRQPEGSAALRLYGPLTLYISLFLTSFGVAITILQRPEVALIGMLAMGPFIIIALTNLRVYLFTLKNITSPAINQSQ